MSRYVDVALPVPLPDAFCYSVPEKHRASNLIGRRVLVPFAGRALTGVAVGAGDHSNVPEAKVKAVEAVLDSSALLDTGVLELCRWIAQYYQAPVGEVVRAALPPGATVAAAVVVELTEQGKEAIESRANASVALRSLLVLLYEAEGQRMRRAKLLSTKVTQRRVLAQAEACGLVRHTLEVAKPRVTDREVLYARLVKEMAPAALEDLQRSPAKQAVVRALDHSSFTLVSSLRRINARITAHVKALEKSGVVVLERRPLREMAGSPELAARYGSPNIALNAEQKTAVTAIGECLRRENFAGFLLHGITGSGKTEVYLHAISEALQMGKGAIVLVPEISLTPQLAGRFRARFAGKVAILHSGLTDRERYDEWFRLREGEAMIVVGARSAVFAPVRNLGIVVVDEEHDSSFKQEDGVRYHARDVALVRAQRAEAPCVLGSATPSLESYFGSEQGRLTRLVLSERATESALPEVELVDLRREKADAHSLLSARLKEAIVETLARRQQVILFLNRRGYDTYVFCAACGESMRCDHCAVSLTHHRLNKRLECHYCGLQRPLPDRCPACQADGMVCRGVGTEKVAAATAELFPNARVERLDRDVGNAASTENLLARFSVGDIDILVGTQMVTKGHDFPNVTLVGVLCADTGLSLPDFRASERTFQLLTQVAGRAGRGSHPGRVIVQTYRVDAPAIQAAAKHDYNEFAKSELAFRQELNYPPYGYLVAIRVDGVDEAAVGRYSRQLAERIRRVNDKDGLGVTVLGPSAAPLSRLKGRCRWHFWLRSSQRSALRHMSRLIAALPAPGREIRFVLDIDPVSSL